MLSLIPAFNDSLYNSSDLGFSIDLLELGVDSVMNDGILRDIPIVSTLVGASKLVIKIREYNLLKQTLAFISEFRSGNISPEELKCYQERLETNPKRVKEELSRVLVFLDRITDEKKSRLLALIYLALVRAQISWDSFFELSEIVDRLFSSDIQLLEKLNIDSEMIIHREGNYSAERLIAIGLLVNYEERSEDGKSFRILPITQTPFKLSSLGKLFCKCCLTNN